LNIGYVYNLNIIPPKGGNHVHALELLTGFVERGHQVAVVNDSTVQVAKNFGSSVAELQEFANWIDVLYVRIDGRYLSSWGELGMLNALVSDKPIVWEINAPANEALAYSHLGGLLHWSRSSESLYKRMKRCIHAYKKYPGIILEEKLRKKMANKVDAAICVSSALGNYAINGLGVKKTLVVPNGGPFLPAEEINARSCKKVSEKFTVLYSGSAMYPWQGLNLFAEAIKQAEKKYPEIRFVMAVNQRSDYIPNTTNLEVKEGLGRDQLFDEICQADLCVAIHPEYFWSKWGFHGSPMKMFEYMACDSAVLASNIGQMKDILHDEVTGFLCENTPESILDKIIFARDNPILVKKVGTAGKNLVDEEYSWKNNVARTIEVFENVIEDRSKA